MVLFWVSEFILLHCEIFYLKMHRSNMEFCVTFRFVLGPMVYGIAFCPLEQADILKELGCADSKQLTEEKREVIFNDICTKEYANTNIAWAVEVISPNVISNSMFRRAKHSLNEVSMDSAIGLINRAIALGANIAEVYVDTVGPPEKYEAKLSKLFPDFKITVAKKADSTYPIVSAASICAKVSRDHALKVWEFPEGLAIKQDGFGSGYPGDPVTKAFLQENVDPVFGFPRLVRFSWSTAENVLLKKAIHIEFEDQDDPAAAAKKAKPTKGITNFFSPNKQSSSRQRHTYFRDRCLVNVNDI